MKDTRPPRITPTLEFGAQKASSSSRGLPSITAGFPAPEFRIGMLVWADGRRGIISGMEYTSHWIAWTLRVSQGWHYHLTFAPSETGFPENVCPQNEIRIDRSPNNRMRGLTRQLKQMPPHAIGSCCRRKRDRAIGVISGVRYLSRDIAAECDMQGGWHYCLALFPFQPQVRLEPDPYEIEDLVMPDEIEILEGNWMKEVQLVADPLLCGISIAS